MKYAVIMIPLLVLSSGPAYAEWVLIDKTDDGMSAYVDPATIRRKGDLVKMWQLADFKNVQNDNFSFAPYLSFKGQSEYDCAEERHRTLTATWFSGNMGHGTIVEFDSDKKKWQPVPPESVNQTMWKLACGKQ